MFQFISKICRGSFVLIQLISSMIIMACVVFELDLLTIFYAYRILKYFFKINFNDLKTFQQMKHPSFMIVTVILVSVVGILNLFL